MSMRKVTKKRAATMDSTDLGTTEKWSFRVFSGWVQEIYDWTDPETKEFYPATFAWHGHIQGRRVNPSPEAEYFHLNVRIPGKKGEPIDAQRANVELELAVELFDEYADCNCKIGKNCFLHGGLNAEKSN